MHKWRPILGVSPNAEQCVSEKRVSENQCEKKTRPGVCMPVSVCVRAVVRVRVS